MKINFRNAILPGFLLLFNYVSAQVNLTAGLAGYYPFSGNANDASGNNNNGLLQNGVQLTSDRFGNPNSAYYFDGVDDYIKVADNGAFSTPYMSLVIWFQTQSNDLQVLVGKRKFEDDGTQGGGAQYQFFINYPPFPGIGSNLVGSNSTCSNVSNSSYINTNDWICANKWYMAVITFDGSTHKIYIDGVLRIDIPTSFPSMLLCNSELRFGNWWSGGTLPFKGKLDDIRWYNRPLNQDEITALYDNFSGAGVSSSDFSFSQDACDPATINFVNNTPNTQNLTWYFGDGNTSVTTNPVHNYDPLGNYNIKLFTTNTSGCIDSISKQISINISQADIIKTKDTSICAGESVQINTLASSDFCWANGAGLNNMASSDPIATPVQTTTYHFNAKQRGTNAIINGDFSSGSTGFTSEYSFAFSNTTEGEYFVGQDPATWNAALSGCADHSSGNGNMMLINGAPQPNIKVWCQTVAVVPNTNYEFSAWVQSLFPNNPSQLQFSINGVQEGTIFTAGAPCNWLQYFSSWNSGTNTVATICIENKNIIVDGNDFALDDIVLAPVFLREDSVTITVLPVPDVQASKDTTLCQGRSAQLNASGAANFIWSPSTGLSDPGIPNPVATPASTTQYILTGFDNPGCTRKDTVRIVVAPFPVFSLVPLAQSVCSGKVFTIMANGADSYSWYTLTQNNLSSNSGLSLPAGASETYYVAMNDSVCQVSDTLSGVINVIPNPIITVSKSNDIDCTLPQAQLTASGGTTYSWSPVINISNPDIPNPFVFPDSDTWYKVTATGSTGCSSKDSILVKSDFSKGQTGFYIPNAFTPNNDGINDCFGVRYWGETKEFELSIYNRWGQLIFLTRNKQECWDGTFKGVQQPSGVFVYQISAKGPCSPGKIYRKGTVALIR